MMPLCCLAFALRPGVKRAGYRGLAVGVEGGLVAVA